MVSKKIFQGFHYILHLSPCKTSDPRVEAISDPRAKNLGISPLDKATYQIWKPYA